MKLSSQAEAIVHDLQGRVRATIKRHEATVADASSATRYLAGIYCAAEVEAMVYAGTPRDQARAAIVAHITETVDLLLALAPAVRVNKH